MSILTSSPKGSNSICRSSLFVVSSWKFTTNRVSEGWIFLRRSSSFFLILPSPLANSTRSADERFGTSLRKALHRKDKKRVSVTVMLDERKWAGRNSRRKQEAQ